MTRLLVVTPQFPYPTRSGFDVRTADLVAHLALHHEVHLLVAENRGSASRPIALHPDLATVNFVDTGSDGAGLSYFARRAYRRLCNPTFTSWSYAPKRLEARIASLHTQHAFDAVLVQTPALAPALRSLRGPRRIIDAVDLWYERYESFAQIGQGHLLAHLRDRATELRAYREFADYVLATSRHDEAAMVDSGIPRERVLHTPVAFEPRPLELAGDRPTILFAGASGVTNEDAVDFFVKDVMPRVHEEVPDARLLLLRANAEQRATYGALEDVVFLPDFDDIDDAYRLARIAVVPLRLGSGIKIKVLESLSRGVPTIVTPVAGCGIDLEGYAQREMTSEPAPFAAEVAHALRSPEYRTELRRSGLEIIDRHYRPDVAYAPLLEVLEKTSATQLAPSGLASSSRG